MDSIYNLTNPVVLAHPNLFEARAFKGKDGKPKGDAKFGGSFVFDPENADFVGIKSLCVALAKDKWPNVDIKTVKFPFSSGNKLIEKRKAKLQSQGKPYDGKADFQADKVVLKSSSKFQPRLSGIENGRIVDYETDAAKTAAKGKFYFGVEVLAQLNFVPYEGDEDNEGVAKRGVTCYLNMVLTTNKGTRLSGGASASEVFKGYAGNMSAENPLEDDDDIAF